MDLFLNNMQSSNGDRNPPGRALLLEHGRSAKKRETCSYVANNSPLCNIDSRSTANMVRANRADLILLKLSNYIFICLNFSHSAFFNYTEIITIVKYMIFYIDASQRYSASNENTRLVNEDNSLFLMQKTELFE